MSIVTDDGLPTANRVFGRLRSSVVGDLCGIPANRLMGRISRASIAKIEIGLRQVMRRFDQAKPHRQRNNLLILWADETQRFMTANEDGMSDYNSIDVIREANATVVAAAQSSTSFLPALGREKSKVLVLNLRNRIIFKAADEEGAQESADFLGKKRVVKKTWGVSAGQRNRSYTEQEEHKIKPHILRYLPKHTAVLVHCERGFKRTILPPLEPTGQVSPWFSRRWL